MRECVTMLVSLEVPTANVGEVIKEVLSAAGIKIATLPSRHTVVQIADEAAFLLSKAFGEKLEEAESWGVNKDGTSRQKKKILTSTLSLANGEEIQLRFKTVARETGERISSSVQEDLEELRMVRNFDCEDEDTFLTNILMTFTSTMSDRAANEKKANELLKKWRDQILMETENMDEISTLHNFYCMAHVLLGFHSYADKNFREQHRKYIDQNIRLGREASGAFLKFKREFPAHRLIRLASNSCGPVGDEKSGVREKWLAYCRSTGTKSLLQSHRDNRFNALFETAAQVHHHKQDLFTFLSMLENKNLMLRSVFEDLTDPRVRSMVHALAVVYVHITGPYWDLVNSKRVQYLELYILIQSLADAISRWKEEPMEVLKFRAAQPILPDFPPDTQGPLYSSAMAEPEEKNSSVRP
ncbi:hypothetical protein ACOMHN_026246 [Nucella lapillus]